MEYEDHDGYFETFLSLTFLHSSASAIIQPVTPSLTPHCMHANPHPKTSI